MNSARGRAPGRQSAPYRGRLGRVLMHAVRSLVLLGTAPALAGAQQSATAALVFDGVTIVDVEQGTLVPGQRVVIAGNRIQRVGDVGAVQMPKGGQVVDARGKYLIPGLWDLHVHPRRKAHIFYPLFLANGVTGIRDAWSDWPLDTLIRWRQEILAGTRVGPPRQLLSGAAINAKRSCTRRGLAGHICVSAGDSTDARQLVEALRAAGADMLKMYGLSRKDYLTIAAEARRQGVPFGGHMTWAAIREGMTYLELSDSGAAILDHDALGVPIFRCWGPADNTTVEQCRPIAERFRRNGTWWVPTLTRGRVSGPRSRGVYARFKQLAEQFWSGSLPQGNWLRDSSSAPDSVGYGEVAQRVGMPILAGTDDGAPVIKRMPPGFTLHAELAVYAAEGLSPLTALQSATLNPAKMLHATDSLGTVAPGKLADLVLLDADPLADITNTTTIRAVVANGRYFDRAALDSLLVDGQAEGP